MQQAMPQQQGGKEPRAIEPPFPLDLVTSAFAREASKRLTKDGGQGRHTSAPELQQLAVDTGDGDPVVGWALLDAMTEEQYLPLIKLAEDQQFQRYEAELAVLRSRRALPSLAAVETFTTHALDRYQTLADEARVSNQAVHGGVGDSNEGNPQPPATHIFEPNRSQIALEAPTFTLPTWPKRTIRKLQALAALVDKEQLDPEEVGGSVQTLTKAFMALMKAVQHLAITSKDQAGHGAALLVALTELKAELAGMGTFLAGVPQLGPWAERTSAHIATLETIVHQLQADANSRATAAGSNGGANPNGQRFLQVLMGQQQPPPQQQQQANQAQPALEMQNIQQEQQEQQAEDMSDDMNASDDLPLAEERCLVRPDHEMPPGHQLQLISGAYSVWNGTVYVPYNRWFREVTAAPERPPALTTVVGPTKVRMLQPQHFSGDSGEISPELALMGMEKYFSSCGLAKSEWGQMAQPLLRGAALKAYSALALPLHHAGKAPQWQQVSDLILSFKRADAPTLARAQLANIKQVGTVSEYTNKFKLLLTQVGNDPPAPTDLLRYYRSRKLLQKVRARLLHPGGATHPTHKKGAGVEQPNLGTACEQAFQGVKTALTNAPVLIMPDQTKGGYEVICDASLSASAQCSHRRQPKAARPRPRSATGPPVNRSSGQ